MRASVNDLQPLGDGRIGLRASQTSISDAAAAARPLIASQAGARRSVNSPLSHCRGASSHLQAGVAGSEQRGAGVLDGCERAVCCASDVAQVAVGGCDVELARGVRELIPARPV